jgi:hypothetical protein
MNALSSAAHVSAASRNFGLDFEDIYDQPEYEHEAFDEEDMRGVAARSRSQMTRPVSEANNSRTSYPKTVTAEYRPTVPIPSLSEAVASFLKKADRKKVEQERKEVGQKRILEQKQALEDEIRQVSGQLEAARARLAQLEGGSVL